MKSELVIAQENVDNIKENIEITGKFSMDADEITKQSETHKTTCQRFLEFLEGLQGVLRTNKESSMRLDMKITDLKQAIKTYKDAGI